MSIFGISGGAGFLGAAIAQRLGRAGHEVRVLDDFSSPAAAGRARELSALPSVSISRGDVRDKAACRSLCRDAEYVLHFASPCAAEADAAPCLETVAGGALALMEAAREFGATRRFVLASSSAVYGDNSGFTRHEASLPDPATPLACAQLSAEHFCRWASRQGGVGAVCLRFFDIYGPGMDVEDESKNAETNSVAHLVRAAVTGEAAAVSCDSGQSADWVYVDDAVEATLRAVFAQRGVSGKVFNVGSGRPLPNGAVRDILQGLTGRPVPILAAAAAVSGNSLRSGRADTAAAAGLLQFAAAIGPEEGLAQTLHWAQKHLDCMKLAA